MTYTKEQLIDALYNEYEYLIHDDFDPDTDLSPPQYLDMLKEMNYDELVEETQTDANLTLNEYMEMYGELS